MGARRSRGVFPDGGAGNQINACERIQRMDTVRASYLFQIEKRMSKVAER